VLPTDPRKLEEVREECRKMVLRRATTSAGFAVIPIPGIDIAADVGLLMKLLPEINRRFGLTPEQIGKLEPERKLLVYALIKKSGSTLIGRVITKKIVIAVLKRVGIQMTAKQAAKYVPFAGQVASAVLGFGAMMYIGTSHIDECYQIARGTLNGR
jgi:uncharacterized protein (DUF697 family)